MAELRDFQLPDLGEGLTEAALVRWLVDVGDRVEADQAIAEVTTDKAEVQVPTPFAGVVRTLHAQPGETVAVGRPLITVEVERPPEPEAGYRTRERTEHRNRRRGRRRYRTREWTEHRNRRRGRRRYRTWE